MEIITSYLDNSAQNYPQKLALVDSKRKLSFSELREEAQKMATTLIKHNIFHQPVAILLEQSVESITSFMGVTYSGNFYTVLDTKMPSSRLQKIIDTLKPAVILTDEAHIKKLTDIQIGNAKILEYNSAIQTEINEEELKKIATNIRDQDILYILFTSGSTGIPKGVTIGQRSVMDYTEWVSETFKVDKNTIIANQAPFYFDNSVLDIYQTLKNAATLYITPRSLFSFPMRLLEYLRDNKINMIFWVPSILCSIANFEVLNECDISCLKKVLFAGEVMPNKQLNQWRKCLPEALFANLYGPTEITVDCTYYIVNREFKDNEPLPIGIPCRENTILVLNDEDKLVIGKEQGELCVKGRSLAYGYYNNPEKTAEVFVQNPLNSEYEIIYRTGDLVHYNERNELMYDGRKDFQIKHMGHRIELGEIETAATSLDGINNACCLYDTLKEQIILCYIGSVESKQLAKKLRELLPEYMVPKIYQPLEIMPLNQNGKIDRNKLKLEYIGE